MTTSKERIKQLIKDRFYDKPEALLRFAEIPNEDLRDFMNGKRDFTAEQYGRIADQAGVSVRWLMTGEDETDVLPTAPGSLGSQADAPKAGRLRSTGEPPAVAEGKEKEPSADRPKPRRGRPRKQVKPVSVGHACTERRYLPLWRRSSQIFISVVKRKDILNTFANPFTEGLVEKPKLYAPTSARHMIVPSAYRGICIFGSEFVRKSFPIWDELIRSTAFRGWNMLLCAARQSGLHERFLAEFKRNFLPGNTFHCIDFSDAGHSYRINPLFACADVWQPYGTDSNEGKFVPTHNLLQLCISFLGSCLRYLELTGAEWKFLLTELEACSYCLASVIDLLCCADRVCYDADGNELHVSDSSTASFVDGAGTPGTVAYRIGRYADFPHVVAFFMQQTDDVLQAIRRVGETGDFIRKFFGTTESVREINVTKQFLDQLAPILQKLATPAAFWILSGPDFPLSMRCGAASRHLSIRYDAASVSAETSACRAWSNVVLNAVIAESRADFHNLSEMPSRVLLNRPLTVMVDDMCRMVLDKPDVLLGIGRVERLSFVWGIPSVDELRAVYGKAAADGVVEGAATAIATPSCGDSTRKELRERRTDVPVEFSELEDKTRGIVTFLADVDDTLPMLPSSTEPLPVEGAGEVLPADWEEKIYGNYQRILAKSAELCARMCQPTAQSTCHLDE